VTRTEAPPGASLAAPVAPPVPVPGWLDALPRLAAFVLVALGLVGTPLLLLGAFEQGPVLLGTLVLTVLLELGWRRSAAPGRASRAHTVVGLLALGVAVGSVVLNGLSHSQHLLVDGDPAVYAVTGQLLAERGTLEIATGSESVFGGVDTFNYAGAGFDAYEDETVVRPSFMHLLPMVLAVASWLGDIWMGGPQALLVANAVLSGLALLAVYAFGARLLRSPVMALVATTALALTLPQQHFSRDTFSEIPAQLLVFAGLALLFDVVARDRKPLPALLAGLVLGVSCIARIDAFFYLVPLVVFATVLVFAGLRAVAAWNLLGLAVGAVLGYLDLRIASPSYLGLQSENLNLIFVALAGITVLCAVALALRRRSLALWQRLQGPALAAVAVVGLLLLSLYAGVIRPEVEVGRNLDPAQPTAVASLQQAAGLPVDPLQSYDELSVQWLAWYLGPVAVALGLLAFALLTGRALRRDRSGADARWTLAGLAFLLLFGATTALYVWRPSIIPVHYWATRRFLPVTIPGLLLLAAWLPVTLRGAWRAVVGVAVAVALLVPPVVFLRGHLTEREYVPMLAITERVCEALRPDDAVVLLGGDRLATGFPQTVQIFCGVPTAVIDRQTTAADLQAAVEAIRAAGRNPVFLSPRPDPQLADGPAPGTFEPVVDLPVSVVALSLTGRPDERFEFAFPVYLSRSP
jgi:hypothetical protein